MFKDGKYKLHKDEHEYEAVITTLSVHDGLYSKTSDMQFVCIPGHFPIPFDSWLLEDFLMIPDDAIECLAKKKPRRAGSANRSTARR